ncbi:MAG TPA: hypothetical protein VL485_15985 [Ktedonobacteraceae bacterium]|jgi:hypothetical protein|nr:hypothetical protein [Ktedonobacteraceae bacterium]
MSSLFGRDEQELYERAFEKGVLLKNFHKAADLFDEASKKASRHGNQALTTQAAANALLYRYLATQNPASLQNLLHLLRTMTQIERIGGQRHEMMPTEPLCAELDCRLVEAAITQAMDDVMRLRDLHKAASTRFLAIICNPLLTYEYVRSGNGHDERTDERYFFHEGMYQFYEAMLKKDRYPGAAADDLALALQAFRRCNDTSRIERMETLLNNWRVVRTCWICHREVQGADLHFSLCRATLTPYTKELLEKLNQDPFTINLQEMKVVVCSPCGSMITFRAAEEAERVRRDLLLELAQAYMRIDGLDERLHRLEQSVVVARNKG